ncbi:MAG: hypothetical protein LUH10_14305, partial [Tannerellaceae bacterium]|nr:hypothetical protein [Tannerellaceae bacterium]
MAIRVFINREIEKIFFEHDIATFRPTHSRIVIISASTGWGKSCLIDEVIKNRSDYDLDHRVKIKQKESEDCDSGFFIKKLVKQLDINSLRSKPEYLRFNEFVHQENLSEIIGGVVIKKFLTPIGGNDYLNQRKSDDENIQEWLGNELNLLLLGKEYIKYILKKRRIIVAIENIQNIDEYSIKAFRDILRETNNAYFIFEYTTGERSNISISELRGHFQNITDISDYTLAKLDKHEIIKTLDKEDEVIIGILNDTYEASDGNLFKLSLLLNDIDSLKPHKNLAYNETIKNIITHLSDPQKMVLLIIESHRGVISPSLLKEIVATHLADLLKVCQIDSILTILAGHHIIEYTKNNIKIAHDSLIRELNIIDGLQK